MFWGTSNPGPWNTVVRSSGNGDYGKLTNLYTSSTSRSMPTPARSSGGCSPRREDAWDYDGVNELVLADLPIGGKRRRST